MLLYKFSCHVVFTSLPRKYSKCGIFNGNLYKTMSGVKHQLRDIACDFVTIRVTFLHSML